MKMKVKDYEAFVTSNAKIGLDDLTYSVIGLCGETGEVAEWFKKRVHRGNEKFTDEMLFAEIGDVLHYATRIALHKGWTLKEVMAGNVEKLEARNR